jgi:integrase
MWRNALKSDGIRDTKFHGLLHFYPSGHISAGCEIVTAQRTLGHAKTTTLDTYERLWPIGEDRARAAAQSPKEAYLNARPPEFV